MFALLSLGGNVGDRQALMDAAVAALGGLIDIRVVARSPAYRTEPDGPVEQPWFINLAVAVRTTLDPTTLRERCRTIEGMLGRNRASEIPWGPRPIDIDVVATGESLEAMEAPAGRFDDRPFVVIPLADIAPDTAIGGETLVSRAARADRSGIAPL